MQPDTLFAHGPEGQVAYQVFGDGPFDLVFNTPWMWNIEVMWEEPRIERFMDRLASFSRVIVFDSRGIGLSDPVPLGALPTLEEWTDDIRVVLDAVGSERAAIVGASEGAQMAMIFAAAHPDRSTALVTINGAACYLRHDDYPAGLPTDLIDAAVEAVSGERARYILGTAPSLSRDERSRRWYERFLRLSASPTTTARMFRNGLDWDLRAVLPAIRVPTLVIHRTGDRYMRRAHAPYLASHIAGAKLVELPGDDDLFWAGDSEGLLDEIQAFLTGHREAPERDRILATVLFTDLVASTDRAAELGDRRWRQVLDGHDRISARHVDHFRGRVVKTTGDGVLATFDGPARAIRCARAVAEEVRSSLGVDVRAGLHTGEVELRGDDIGGIGVHITARVMAEADPGEVLVSSTVKDLVIGSGIEFDDRGEHALKGVPGDWRLYAVKG